MENQPAIKNYFFNKGFKDLKNVINDSWDNNMMSSKDYFDESKDGDTWVGKIFFFAAGLSVVFFGTASFLAISLIHILILFVVLSVVFLLFSLILGIDYLYRIKNKIFVACPYCYTKSLLPIYHCPDCNRKHTQLWPGKYGILKRTCICGCKLPTTFFNGRSKLTATCSNPNCNHELETEEARPMIIPIIGAPSVGKTYFLFSLVYTIKEKLAPKGGHQFNFINNRNKSIYESEINVLNSGRTLGKTNDYNPTALNFFLTKNKKKTIFYFYDPAGEVLKDSHYLAQHEFYKYFHGLIFIIDPFSIESIRDKYQEKLHINSKFRTSKELMDDVYSTLLINLEKNYGIKGKKRLNKPVAIVFSKVDAFDLKRQIGKEAANNLLKIQPELKTKDRALDLVCRDFLRENNLGHSLQKIEWKFPNARFFSVSSSGKNSEGIEDVAKWLFGSINKKYQFK